MPLGQGWLNAWVKVNSKHVVFPPNDRANNRDHHHHHPKLQQLQIQQQQAEDNATHQSQRTAASSVTNLNEDAEDQAIKRFNSRKHKRRLQKSVSAADLLRDKSKTNKGAAASSQEITTQKVPQHQQINTISEKDQEGSHGTANTKTILGRHSRSSDLSETDHGQEDIIRIPQHQQHQHEDFQDRTNGSLRFVAGFFGADMERYSSGHGDAAAAAALSSPHYVNQKSSFNHDTGSVQFLLEQHTTSKLDAASIVSRGGQSAPPRPQSAPQPRPYASAAGGRSVTSSATKSQGGIGIPFPFGPKEHCRSCRQLENDLLSSREDLEYLRGMALRSEYTCNSCQVAPRRSGGGAVLDALQRDIGSVSERAQLLNDVTARHKSQIEQMTKERVRVQSLLLLRMGSQFLIDNFLFPLCFTFFRRHDGNKTHTLNF
jgi:hypothetical protein